MMRKDGKLYLEITCRRKKMNADKNSNSPELCDVSDKRVDDKSTDASIDKELIAENQRLRMENAYLKKLQALVQERIRRTNGKK